MITLVNGHTDVADILADQDPRMLETILMDPLASMANRMNCFKLLTCLLKSASIERSDRLVDAMKARKFTNYVLSNSELCEEQIKTVYYMPIALMCLANELYLVKVPGKEFCHTKDGRRVISTCYELLRKHGKRDGLCQHGTVVMGMVCDIVNEWWWFYLESIDLSEPSGKVFEAMMIYMDFTHSVENLRGSYKRKMLDTMKAIHEHINFGAIRHVQQEIADRNAQALLRELEEVAQRARPSRPKKEKETKKEAVSGPRR